MLGWWQIDNPSCCQAGNSKGRVPSTTHHWLVSKISAISQEKTAAPAFIWSHRNSFFKAKSLSQLPMMTVMGFVICMIVNNRPGWSKTLSKKYLYSDPGWPWPGKPAPPTQYEPSLTQVGSPLGADPGGWYIPPLPHPWPDTQKKTCWSW